MMSSLKKGRHHRKAAPSPEGCDGQNFRGARGRCWCYKGTMTDEARARGTGSRGTVEEWAAGPTQLTGSCCKCNALGPSNYPPPTNLPQARLPAGAIAVQYCVASTSRAAVFFAPGWPLPLPLSAWGPRWVSLSLSNWSGNGCSFLVARPVRISPPWGRLIGAGGGGGGDGKMGGVG